jgi:pyruvate,water dikinase
LRKPLKDKATAPDSPRTLPLASDRADLSTAGGKGANLARLAQAGFPMPDGFIVPTAAYRDFVTANKIEARIQEFLPGEGDGAGSLEALEDASQRIRAVFTAGKIPSGLADDLRAAYKRLGNKPVAVRSSATAEDLPGMSFAGQQDTYLNVVGEDALLKAVVDCWSSLWTARAIGYRARNRVAHAGAALAVVVQEMVESRASGVLFTANPLTGLRSETVIDATLGLGEALVSGKVDPDHYVVDTAGGRILSKTLGAKELSIHGLAGGGTREDRQKRGAVQALPDDAILALARLGKQVAGLYDFPQDVEWAWTDDRLVLLQSRPITSLFPTPEGVPAEPLKIFFSFAAVQGMLDPLTPLGRDSLREIFAMGAGLFGIRVTRATQNVLYTAGERLWANFTTLMRNSVGRRAVPVALGFLEPTIRQAVRQVWDDPRLQPGRPGISFHARMQLARMILPTGANILLNLMAPRRRRVYIVANGERLLQAMDARCAAITGDRREKLAARADLLPDLAKSRLIPTLRLFFSAVSSGMLSWNFLNLLTAHAGDGSEDSGKERRDLLLQVTRGMPYNPTTEMDLALWEMARTIRQDPDSLQAFRDDDPAGLSRHYLAGGLPGILRQAIDRFLERYGGRGFGEIDLGRTRWVEDPTHVFEMLSSFVQIEDASQAPDAVFARSVTMAEQAIAELAASVRREPKGWLKSRLLRFFAGRARQLMGARESPKFFAVRMMFRVHRELLKSGAEFVQAGELDAPDDLFYLTLSELKALAGWAQPGGTTPAGQKDWRTLIARRRESYRSEMLRRQIPRLLLSDGRAFYEGLRESDDSVNAISGSPVSPGSVEGRVRVVLDPRQAHLQPGEILVCPGTDPAWTPLFLTAAGLVMETGGMMTHGAVVAREYGIPAIVGVDRATERLQTGQLIRIDGSSGQIKVLESESGRVK